MPTICIVLINIVKYVCQQLTNTAVLQTSNTRGPEQFIIQFGHLPFAGSANNVPNNRGGRCREGLRGDFTNI